MDEIRQPEEEVLKTDLHIQAAYRLTEALVASENKLRRRLELLSEVVFETDERDAVQFLNKAWQEILGFEVKRSLGASLDSFVIDEYRPLLADYLAAAKIDSPRKPQELRLKTASEETVWMELSASPLTAGGLVGTLYNITPRKSMQHDLQVTKEAAERASQAKSIFLAAMSHEIRTPMNGVLGMIALMLEGKLDPEQKERAEIIRSSGEALLTIVNDILDYSKIEAGRLSLWTEAFGPRAVLEDTVALFRGSAETKKIALSGHFDGDESLALIGDRGRIRQVLMNLVSNAIKFTQAGQVQISLTLERVQESADVSVEVKDTGIGIAQADLSRLFIHFSQLDASLTRQAGGAGLGLAISKQLIDMMGGQIGVDTNPGEGSKFWFRVRLPIAQSAAAHQARDVVSTFNFAGLNALIAEDNLVNQLVLKGILDRMGCRVEIADNGQEAVDLCASHAFDFIMMDVQMPVMDGLAATQSIRRTSAVPILGVTANVLPEHVEACIACGMNGFVPKPVNRQALESELGRVLSSLTQHRTN